MLRPIADGPPTAAQLQQLRDGVQLGGGDNGRSAGGFVRALEAEVLSGYREDLPVPSAVAGRPGVSPQSRFAVRVVVVRAGRPQLMLGLGTWGGGSSRTHCAFELRTARVCLPRT